MIRLANVRNGLAYPHDGLCYFQSNHGHHAADGYFRIDAMPLDAVRLLLLGGQVVIVDAGRADRLTDALRFGVPTWCAVFNRAIQARIHSTCPWFTSDMLHAAWSARQRPLKQTIRKLAEVYGASRPAVVGKNILLECHRCDHDDRPEVLRAAIYCSSK